MRVLCIGVVLSVAFVVTAQTMSNVTGYRTWSRMGDERPMLGPLDCPFSIDEEAHPTRSQAERGAHSRKAFFLYVNDANAYRAIVQNDAEPTEGLIIVKETFRPVDLGIAHGVIEPRPMPTPTDAQRVGRRTYQPRREGRRLLGVGEPVGLFVMRYHDGGWRFATVHFDGRIENDGAMPQCARCHRDAPHHGVFGAGL